MRSKEIIGAGCTVLSAVLFGTMPLMAKTAFAMGSNAYTTAFGRFATGAIVAGILLRLLPKHTIRVSPAQLRWLTVLSLFYAATPVLLYSSYQSIDSGLASTLHFTYPVAVMLLTAIIFRERMGWKEVISAVLCMGGMLLINPFAASASMTGMLLAALSGLAYAGYIVLLGKSNLQSLSALTVTFWLSAFSALEIFLFSFCTGNLLLELPAKVWLPYAGLGVFATVMALALFQIGVFLCGSVKASLLSTFEPLTGVLLGVIIFQETLELSSVFGMILILCAVILLVIPIKKYHTNL